MNLFFVKLLNCLKKPIVKFLIFVFLIIALSIIGKYIVDLDVERSVYNESESMNSTDKNTISIEYLIDLKTRTDVKLRSKMFYKKEGEMIFGDFFFGMSEKDFNSSYNKIKKETGGLIRIGNYDFTINEIGCKFVDNKLYRMQIDSDDFYEIYYDKEAHDHSKDKFDDFYVTKGVKEYLSKKYGPPTNNSGFSWFFDYKNISIFECTKNYIDDTFLKTYYVSIAVSFINPALERIAKQREEKEKLLKSHKEECQQKKEKRIKDSIIVMKKSFSKGL